MDTSDASAGTPSTPSTPSAPQISFPRQQARTARFTRGLPRAFHITPGGSRVWFLRSSSGTDAANALWVLDLTDTENGLTGTERLIADPRGVLGGGDEELSPEERARRERSREGGAGIVGYATDTSGRLASFALSSKLFVADAASGAVGELPAQGPVVDPRIDPTGTHVAYAAGGALRLVGVDSDAADAADRALVEPDGPDVTWGLADFAAAEEMGRHRGFWWSPDGTRLLVARVDESGVQRFHIADPANPDRPAVERAYPAAGTPNAEVGLAVVGVDGGRVDVAWDREAYEYLASVSWTDDGALAVVQSRDQRALRVLRIDPDDGSTTEVFADHDPVWIELVGGTPEWHRGRLVWVADRDGWRRVLIDGEPVTPAGLQVRALIGADDDGVYFSASAEPTEVHLWHVDADAAPRPLTVRAGVHAGTYGSGTLVVQSAALDTDLPTIAVRRIGAGSTTDTASSVAVDVLVEQPVVRPTPRLLHAGEHGIRTAVLLPHDYDGPAGSLPVLMDPYGGPHAQRVLATRAAFRTSQWLADQGFAVVVADGRGTPGRGYDFERAIARDLATPVLEDQVTALHAAAEAHPELDLRRVGILGWSFGGYLAALAVLRRPDVFHAAVAGAPVTEWRLYDTHYTERYLGDPRTAAAAYDNSSLLRDAPTLDRPLMMIHGLADDNVVAAHTLRLSALLTAAGRPHTVLPLSGVTHMTPQEEVAENLLLLQLDFFRRALTPAG